MNRLERSRSDRLVAGVCGGTAAYFGGNADVVRVLWIASIVLGGIGVLPYAVAIFLLPDAPDARRELPWSKLLGFALLGLGILFFFRTFGARVLDPTVLAFWRLRALGPVLLVLAGSWLVWPSALRFLGSAGRRPQRSLTDRVLAGVGGGIARELSVDANVVRLAFVLASSLTFGLAVLLYLMLVVILPEEAVAHPGAPAPGPPDAPGRPGPGAADPDQGSAGAGR